MKILQKISSFGRKNKIASSFFKRSYSQCGEDLIVDYVFSLRGIIRPTYIDIGANHPLSLSNTAYFYEKGCRGINIEANPRLFSTLESHRPQDINLNVGISNEAGNQEFYIMEDDTLSTFSKSERDHMIECGKKVASTSMIKMSTIQDILGDHYNNRFPDFLSLDIEGMDLDILKSIDFVVCAPKVICVESAEYSPIGAGEKRHDLIAFLVTNGYYEYANTNLNAIMVQRSFWFI